MLSVCALDIADVKLITPRRFGDNRGFFSEVFNVSELGRHGIEAQFVQDNHSFSAQAGTVRGLHFQVPPCAQGKLVRVARGRVLDVAVDLRRGSPSYGRHVAAELSAANWAQLWIPPGFAHGFCTLEPDSEILYKTNAYYAPQCDAGIFWRDEALAIDWPVDPAVAILSEKDASLPAFASFVSPFTWPPAEEAEASQDLRRSA